LIPYFNHRLLRWCHNYLLPYILAVIAE